MTIESEIGNFEIPDEYVKYLPPSLAGGEDAEFRASMAEEDIILDPTETVTDYVKRYGFPYSIHPPEERDDN